MVYRGMEKIDKPKKKRCWKQIRWCQACKKRMVIENNLQYYCDECTKRYMNKREEGKE